MTVGDNDHGDADPIRFLIARLRDNTYLSTDPQEAANLLEEMVDAIDDRDELMKTNDNLNEETVALLDRIADMNFRWDKDQDTILRLTKERDEARRNICCQALPSEYKDWQPNEVDYALRLIAAQQGWDCFKEKPNV